MDCELIGEEYLMRTVRLVIILLTLVVVSCNDKHLPTEQERELIAQIEQILSVKQQLASKYWPEFNDEKYSAPIVFYTDSACYVVNPKTRFLKAFPCEKIDADKFQLYKTVRLDTTPYHMETLVNLYDTTTYAGKTPYAMCSVLSDSQKMYPDAFDEPVWAASIIHELVHGCQSSHPCHYLARRIEWPDYDGENHTDRPFYELELASYPSQYPWLCEALMKENGYLLSAISTDDESEMKGFIREFLSCRKERKNRMKSEFGQAIVRQEESFETDESLARFMEVQSAMMLNCDNPIYAEDSFYFCENVKEDYFFITGYNLVRLFLKMGIDLDLPYNSVVHRALESYISID